MPDINHTYQWAVNTCNAPNIGYSQRYRYGQTVNGITYYDCSSFVSKALTVGRFFSVNPWFTTDTEPTYLKKAGFKQIDIHTEWKAGDIVLRDGHTEMVYSGGIPNGGGVTMGAHTGSVALDKQVSINDYTSLPKSWKSLWRYGEGGGMRIEWIFGNRYLNEDEQKNNAYVFYSTMFFLGFTLNSVCGMLGNIEAESTINPAIWQNLNSGNISGGYGLVQWTPSTNYTSWALKHGYDITDGNKQCEWLDTQTVVSGQWIPTTTYPMAWDEFKTSTETPERLSSVFLKNFERAGIEVEEERRKNARKWFDYLQHMTPYPVHPVDGKKHKMPLYFYNFL